MLLFTNKRQELLTLLHTISHPTPTLDMHFKFISLPDFTPCNGRYSVSHITPLFTLPAQTISDTNFVKNDIITCNLSKALLLTIAHTHSCVLYHK